MRTQSNRVDGSSRVMLTIPTALLTQVDNLAKHDYSFRSDVIRIALLEYLRKPANLDKLASDITGHDIALQRVLDQLNKS